MTSDSGRSGLTPARRTVVASELSTMASALRQAGEQLREQNSGSFGASMAVLLAERLDAVTQTMDETDPRRVVESVNRFALRNPAAFLGGAAVLGFVAARFLKASGSKAETPMIAGASAESSEAIQRHDLGPQDVGELLRENPIVAGLAVLTVAAVAGALIPETEKEDRVFGPARDQLAAKAKEMVRERMGKSSPPASSHGTR